MSATTTSPRPASPRTASLRAMGLAAALSFFLLACGGGTDLVAEAETKSEAACACTTFDCTTEHIAWFNKIGFTEEEALDAMSDADRERFTAARSAAADCQNVLR